MLHIFLFLFCLSSFFLINAILDSRSISTTLFQIIFMIYLIFLVLPLIYRPGRNAPVQVSLDHVLPVTRLLDKKQEMEIVKESLENQKKDYQRKQELFKRREESLKKKDLELQEALVLFNKFLKENECKKKRADIKTKAEIERRNQNVEEIKKNIEKLVGLQASLEKKKRQVKKMERYMVFLNEVQNENEGSFEMPKTVMARQKILEKLQNDLQGQLFNKRNENELLSKEFFEFKKEQHNRTLILNNASTDYTNILTKKREESKQLQDAVIDSENKDAVHMQLTHQMIRVIDNIYDRCRKRVNLKKIEGNKEKKDEMLEKLDSIAEALTQFSAIVRFQAEEAKAGTNGRPDLPARDKASQFYTHTRRQKLKNAAKSRPAREPKLRSRKDRTKSKTSTSSTGGTQSTRGYNPNESTASNNVNSSAVRSFSNN